MTGFDWSIVVGLGLFIAVMALITRKYTRTVADFLAANRLAGRYLLTMANDMAGTAAIQVVAGFELYYRAGFSGQWWHLGALALSLIIAASGWAIYRYRESRAMTLGQLFEIRYSKNFRIFMGILGWLSGIVNFGIFPAVGSRFFIYFCGLPADFVLGGIAFSTFAVIMFVLLVIALFFTFVGGQIAVLVTDFMQSAFWNVTMIVILAFMLWKFDWGMISETLSRAPKGESMLNPFDTGQTEGFNFWYFMIMGYFMTIYNCGGLSWQGGTAYHCAAKSASEFKMSRILGIYRVMASSLMVMILAVCAYVIMNHEHFADLAAKVNGVIGQVSTADAVSTETLQKQMLVPVILRNLFPVGLMGLFCAAMFAAFVSTHDTYLHS